MRLLFRELRSSSVLVVLNNDFLRLTRGALELLRGLRLPEIGIAHDTANHWLGFAVFVVLAYRLSCWSVVSNEH